MQGSKFREIYGVQQSFLPEKFDPREFMIMSTDYNRTIMSAYSEIQGYFPAGSVMQLTNDQKLYAKPPFIQDGKVL